MGPSAQEPTFVVDGVLVVALDLSPQEHVCYQMRSLVVGIKRIVSRMKYVSGDEGREIKRSANRAAASVIRENGRSTSNHAGPFFVSVILGVAAIAVGLGSGFSWLDGVTFLRRREGVFRILGVGPLESIPVTTEQIVVVCLVATFTAVAVFLQVYLNHDNEGIVPLYYILGPSVFGILWLSLSAEPTFNHDSWLSTYVETINWWVYAMVVSLPTLLGLAMLGAGVSWRTRRALHTGEGRPTDRVVLEALQRLDQLDRVGTRWCNRQERRMLARLFDQTAATTEARVAQELRATTGRRNSRRLGLLAHASAVGARLRAQSASVALLSATLQVEGLRRDIEAMALSAARGDWTALATETPEKAAQNWLRRNALRLSIGGALVVLGLWLPSAWLASLGLSGQRPGFILVGVGALLAVDQATVGRLHELLPHR